MVEDSKKQNLFKTLKGIRKVVINSKHGGFGLSEEAFFQYIEMAGITDPSFFYFDIERDDPYLVKIVSEMGEAANGPHARLKIVEIPADVDWILQEYGGDEWIAEKHRTWR